MSVHMLGPGAWNALCSSPAPPVRPVSARPPGTTSTPSCLFSTSGEFLPPATPFLFLELSALGPADAGFSAGSRRGPKLPQPHGPKPQPPTPQVCTFVLPLIRVRIHPQTCREHGFAEEAGQELRGEGRGCGDQDKSEARFRKAGLSRMVRLPG